MNQISSPSMPASAAEISTALQVLFDALPFQRGTRTENVALAYIEALRGLSVEAVSEGIRKFLRGECEGVSPRFVPTPPELAKIVRTTVVQARIPAARQISSRPAQTPAERGRMKLKMSLWSAAFGSSRIDDVARANREGFDAMLALAQAWGVPIHDDTWAAHAAPDAEAEWHAARRRAWTEINRNPPPFLRRYPDQFEDAA